jgi:hypothetical protein
MKVIKSKRIGKIISKVCGICNQTFLTYPSHVLRRKYCSHICGAKATRNGWKGDGVGYVGLHTWVKKQLGQPRECKFCNKVEFNNYKIHWANISGKYKRDLEDWIRLCASCHKIYDLAKKTH